MFEKIIFSELGEEQDLLSIMPVAGIDESDEDISEIPETLPVLALKNTVLFPGIVIPITIGRDKSIQAIRDAHDGHKHIAVLSQTDVQIEEAGFDGLYSVGTVARILKLLKMPDGTITAILKGRKRFMVEKEITEDPFLVAEVRYPKYAEVEDEVRFSASMMSIREMAGKIVELSPNIPTEANVMLKNISSDVFLMNFIASNLNVSVEDKQGILEESDLVEKGTRILSHMQREYSMLEVRDQIEHKVKQDIEKQQRDYFLNQQMKAIQQELGQNPQEEEILKLAARAEKKKWSDKVKEHFEKELAKVKRMNPQVAEYSVQLNYLELMLDLPWNEFTEDQFDLNKVGEVLDRDHYGLRKVKDRILEHLAVLKLKGDMKAPILCLVGPPGVGKTSLGRSVAEALGRKFIRMSLGGLHDESEIRGHRKTYIGAMPGRIVQSLKKAKSSNPVFILDEIDKIGKDFRGDPSSAMLEVLDPEQNTSFYDNYLELEYDLSKVFFIATANSLNGIQPALLDRMEVIPISGYSTEEKIKIAQNHLVPKQRKAHGLKAADLKITDELLEKAIQEYTRESGVRSLDRQIASLMRGVAKRVAMEEKYSKKIKVDELQDYLGVPLYSDKKYAEIEVPGVAVGLAWTSVGGDVLFIEASKNRGKGKLTLTGNLGDVMKESATTALSFIKAHAQKLGIDPKIFEETDLHVHVPEGAIPKDGPSAGITMLTALSSVLCGIPVKSYLAMTGEITLRGRVLPVGGIKEKILAARRFGMKEVMLSERNRKHVEEIDREFVEGLEFVYVDRMEEVLEHALGIE